MSTEFKPKDELKIRCRYFEHDNKPSIQLPVGRKGYPLRKKILGEEYGSEIVLDVIVERINKSFIEARIANSNLRKYPIKLPIMGLSRILVKGEEDLEQLFDDDPMNRLRDSTKYETIEEKITEKIPNTFRGLKKYDIRYFNISSSIAVMYSNLENMNNILIEKNTWSKAKCGSKNLPQDILFDNTNHMRDKDFSQHKKGKIPDAIII